MNYTVLGSVGRPYHIPKAGKGRSPRKFDDDDEADNALAKDQLRINRRKALSRRQVSQQAYMDKMKRNLNECQAKHITPYWRNHLSMKGKSDLSSNDDAGWCNMNYPTVL